jgi:hypothetical protein
LKNIYIITKMIILYPELSFLLCYTPFLSMLILQDFGGKSNIWQYFWPISDYTNFVFQSRNPQREYMYKDHKWGIYWSILSVHTTDTQTHLISLIKTKHTWLVEQIYSKGDNLKYDEIVKEINVTVKHDNNCIVLQRWDMTHRKVRCIRNWRLLCSGEYTPTVVYGSPWLFLRIYSWSIFHFIFLPF